MSPNPLPLLSPELLRAQHCHEPGDTRFRAAARLQQSLWRAAQGFPCGRFQDAKGRVRRLGSRLTPPIARTGVNLIEPALAPLVRRELAYREIGAVIEPGRFWGNLLASQPLTFSLFGPMKQNPALATATLRQLAPDLVDHVTDILFEHSPGRGDPRFTEDGTAFDLLIRCTTPGGGRGFVAIELKYSEAPAGVRAPDRPRYAELSRAAGVYREPDSPRLRGGGIEQFWREQLLVTPMLQHGCYDAGRLMVITPALNHDCQAALRRYQRQLLDAEPAQLCFQAVTLEAAVAALGQAGAEPLAARLTQRYLDFSPVHAALAASFEPAAACTAAG